MQGPVLGSRNCSPSCLVAAGFEATQHFARADTSVIVEEEDVAARMHEGESAAPISEELPPRERLGKQVKAKTSVHYPCSLAFTSFPLVNCWKTPKI